MCIYSCCISLCNMHMLHKYQRFVKETHLLNNISLLRNKIFSMLNEICLQTASKFVIFFSDHFSVKLISRKFREKWFHGKFPQKFLCFRCVSCKCMDCPLTAATSGVVINPPLTFVIDTTRSVKPDKDSIFNLTQRVVDRIQETNTNIPQVRQH